MIEGGAIEFGAFVSGVTEVVGQMVTYEFAGEAGQSIFFDYQSTTETTKFTLMAPDGRTELFSVTGDKGPVTLEQSGTYVLTVDPLYDQTTEYEFIIELQD